MAEGQVVGVLRLALALLALAQDDRVAIFGRRAESLHQVTIPAGMVGTDTGLDPSAILLSSRACR